jgi:hypothetical protein
MIEDNAQASHLTEKVREYLESATKKVQVEASN